MIGDCITEADLNSYAIDDAHHIAGFGRSAFVGDRKIALPARIAGIAVPATQLFSNFVRRLQSQSPVMFQIALRHNLSNTVN